MGVALLLPAQTALKLCVSALEKYPDSALLKALKSVALMRTGRQAEAHKVGVEVHGVCSGVQVLWLSSAPALQSFQQRSAMDRKRRSHQVCLFLLVASSHGGEHEKVL